MKNKNIKKIAISMGLMVALSVTGVLVSCGESPSPLENGNLEGNIIENNGNLISPVEMADGTIKLELPTDGSKPEDHTALENIGYIAKKLSTQKFFHTDNVSKATAKTPFMTVNQKVFGSKDYKDGILIFSVLSTSDSGLSPKKALQRFYGNNEIIVRGGPSSPKESDWKGNLDTAWSVAEPSEMLDIKDAIMKYGVLANELCDYVINEKTLLSKDAVAVKNGDEYTLTVEISTAENTEQNLEDGTKYYKCNMKTMGTLDEYPVFSKAEITFTFTSDWVVKSFTTNEVYKSKKIVYANCTGSNSIVFSYEESDVDVSAFETYFSKYAVNLNK